jgi:hypothetical protein
VNMRHESSRTPSEQATLKKGQGTAMMSMNISLGQRVK